MLGKGPGTKSDEHLKVLILIALQVIPGFVTRLAQLQKIGIASSKRLAVFYVV